MEAILNLLTVTAIYLSALSSQSIHPATRTAFKQDSGKKDKLMDTTALGSSSVAVGSANQPFLSLLPPYVMQVRYTHRYKQKLTNVTAHR